MALQKQPPLERGAGVLLPVFSLPSPYGIGTIGREARSFVDFLVRAGQRYWQVLPLGPTSFGDSPYQSFSTFAGNPYFIDLEQLIEEGLLLREEAEELPWAGRADRVDYQALFQHRFQALRKAYNRSHLKNNGEYRRFCRENKDWLDDYALYMALKERHGFREWLLWEEPLRLRDDAALKEQREACAGQIGFWKFCQFLFFQQWRELKRYANQRGISIIGDIPIYVALDSADVWAHPELFQLNEERRPHAVAGVPPDAFSSTGQRWGNPLYDWERMETDGFSWWKDRIAAAASLYDLLRIDHFIGICRYYAIPAKNETAEGGQWIPGPGKKLTDAIRQAAGDCRIIAEDLGVVVPAVRRLLTQAGFPGMKVLSFAFDGDASNEHLPHHYVSNLVVYGGTHDNQTLRGLFSEKSKKELKFARRYLHVKKKNNLPAAVMRAAYESVAAVAVMQMQDLLELGGDARMNLPSTIGNNWQWRLIPGQLSHSLAKRMRRQAETYGRLAPAEGKEPEQP